MQRENIETIEIESEEEIVNTTSKITEAEAIQLLKKLRDEISTKCPEVLSFENLLRDSIINIFIEENNICGTI